MAKSSSKAEKVKVERIIERTMKLFKPDKPDKLGKGATKKLSRVTRQAIDILQSRTRQQLH